jgi:hypothetical protein
MTIRKSSILAVGVLGVVVVVGVGVICNRDTRQQPVAQVSAPAPAPVASTPATAPAADVGIDTPARPVIVRLVGRNSEVTITSGPTGPRYTFKEQGTVIVADADEKYLQLHHPERYQWLRQIHATKNEPQLLAGQ